MSWDLLAGHVLTSGSLTTHFSSQKRRADFDVQGEPMEVAEWQSSPRPDTIRPWTTGKV